MCVGISRIMCTGGRISYYPVNMLQIYAFFLRLPNFSCKQSIDYNTFLIYVSPKRVPNWKKIKIQLGKKFFPVGKIKPTVWAKRLFFPCNLWLIFYRDIISAK